MTDQLYVSIRMRIHQEGLHLSGAEDLVPVQNLGIRLQEFTERFFPFLENATTVPPPKLNFTIDPVPQKNILKKSLLSVQTLNTQSFGETNEILSEILSILLSRSPAIRILDLFKSELLSKNPRNGALLVTPEGEFLLKEYPEGVRTTHVGCTPSLREKVVQYFSSRLQPPHHRFIEALILASKVISSDDVIFELCASDDPNYTTGYLASKGFGYLRIPHIKPPGYNKGGRIYVVKEGANLQELINFLRSTPVLFTEQSPGTQYLKHKKISPLDSINQTERFISKVPGSFI